MSQVLKKVLMVHCVSIRSIKSKESFRTKKELAP